MYDWKIQKSKLSAKGILTLTNHLNCSIDYLLGRTDIPENPNVICNKVTKN